MNKVNNLFALLLAFVLIAINSAVALAEIVPYADTTFKSTSISLSSTGKATFRATASESCQIIKVTNCYLQKKVGSNWTDVQSLTAPPSDSNTNFYSESKSYSSSMTSGNTYRIKATFDADGHTLTKYSGSIDY